MSNSSGLGLIVVGIIALIYGVIFRNRYSWNAKKFVVIDSVKYLKSQFYMFLIIAFISILLGIIIYLNYVDYIFTSFIILIISLRNILLSKYCLSKGYIRHIL